MPVGKTVFSLGLKGEFNETGRLAETLRSSMAAEGFIKAGAGNPRLLLGNPKGNAKLIARFASAAAKSGLQFLVLPELSLAGATLGSLLKTPGLHKACLSALADLLAATSNLDLCLSVSLPLVCQGRLTEAAALCQKGRILGLQPNTAPENSAFSGGHFEKSRISLCGQEVPFGSELVFSCEAGRIALGFLSEAKACAESLVKRAKGSEILLLAGAQREGAGLAQKLSGSIRALSEIWQCGIVLSSAGSGESSTDFVFAGRSLVAENGRILESQEPYGKEPALISQELDLDFIRYSRNQSSCEEETLEALPLGPLPEFALARKFSQLPFVPENPEELSERVRELFAIQSHGLARRLEASQAKSLVIGVSGGLDSTLALLAAHEALKLEGLPSSSLIAVTMPGFGTSSRTRGNAHKLMESLGATILEIPLDKAVGQHFLDIGQDPEIHDATYENSQARERTQILMDLANKKGGIVVGTGDLSEAALGWATYNGDHMSMYNVNCSLPKTLIKAMVQELSKEREPMAAVLRDILDTPISPELVPGVQPTEDLVGPYILHDFFLYHFVRRGASPEKILALAVLAFAGRFDAAAIGKWLKKFVLRFISQQYKRSCSPDGPSTGTVSLSPREGLRFPSDLDPEAFLSSLD